MIRIAPSILSADFSRLGEEVQSVVEAGADWIHIDVMDGHFVPNISFGVPIMKSIRGKTDAPFDVHLMIEAPDKYIPDFAAAGADWITVHQEAGVHLDRTVQLIRSLGVKTGVSLNPATPVETLRHLLPQLDLVLIMSVNPGFGGQSFIPYALEKVAELDAMRKEANLDFLIEVDGGVTPANAAALADAGADVLVAGSAVFKAPDYATVIQAMKEPS